MIPQILHKRRVQVFIVLSILIGYLLWQALDALIPFLLGLVVAYLILPVVNFVQYWLPTIIKKQPFARPLAIVIVYLLGILLVLAAVATIVPPILNQLTNLEEIVNKIYSDATILSEEGLKQYKQLSPNTQARIQEQIQTFDPTGLAASLFTGITSTVGAISNTVSFAVGLIIIPFWLFYILNDEKTVINGVMGIIPHDVRADVEALRLIFDTILAAYIRGQLFLAATLGITISIGLWLLNVPYWLLLGLTAAFLGIFPFIGAILGAIPAIIIAFLQSPTLALWVVGLFVIVQQVDNLFLSPKIMGEAVELHPAIIMVVIISGTSVFGIIGALIAVPLTAILRDVAHYLYLRADDKGLNPIDVLKIVGYGNRVTPIMLQAMAQESNNPEL